MRLKAPHRPTVAALWAAGIAALFLPGPFAVGTRPVAAQSILTPMAYEECIQRQRQLREEAKRAGDRAWSIIMAINEFSSPESNEWYRRATELHKLADKMKCIRNPNSGDKSARRKAASRTVEMLAKLATRNHAQPIGKYIHDRIREVQNHSNAMMTKVDKLQRDVAAQKISSAPQPSPQPAAVNIAGTYVGNFQGNATDAARRGFRITINRDMSYSSTVVRYYGQLRRRNTNTYSIEGFDGDNRCRVTGTVTVTQNGRVLSWQSRYCTNNSTHGIFTRQ